MKTLIAIDPGRSGGVAFQNGTTVTANKMPETEGAVIDLLRSMASTSNDCTAYIERVGGFAGERQPGSRMFTFGRGVGVLIGCLMTLGVKIAEEVRPQEWQKALALGTRGNSSKKDWKNKLKSRAEQLYPTLDVTLATADALLILRYAEMREAMFHRSVV